MYFVEILDYRKNGYGTVDVIANKTMRKRAL